MKREIILTVHNSGSENYRLFLSEEDSSIIEPSSANSISTSLGNGLIRIGALRTYHNHNNIGSPEINSWIKENGYHIYPRNNNTKLIFNVKIEGDSHHYEFYNNQA